MKMIFVVERVDLDSDAPAEFGKSTAYYSKQSNTVFYMTDSGRSSWIMPDRFSDMLRSEEPAQEAEPAREKEDDPKAEPEKILFSSALEMMATALRPESRAQRP